MAMLPFIGYNAGDYFAHWIEVGKSHDAAKLPAIFYVNWFRRDADGRFLWPGFGDNIRVLKWALQRLSNQTAATDTPVGHTPTLDALDTSGLDLSPAELAAALAVDPIEWRTEVPAIQSWLDTIGPRLPTSLHVELDALRQRLGLG
jgi:phosphoenolpyruvate carboxykinase (GTP)